MPPDAGVDPVDVGPHPVHRRGKAVVERHPRLEAEAALGLLGASEAMAGAVPVPGRPELEIAVVAAEPVDCLGELADRGLGAARQVVDVALRAVGRAKK